MEVSHIINDNCSPTVFVSFRHTVPLIAVNDNNQQPHTVKYRINSSPTILTTLTNLVHQVASAFKEEMKQPRLSVHFRLYGDCSGLWSTQGSDEQAQDLNADSDLQTWCSKQLTIINQEMEHFQHHNPEMTSSLDPTKFNLSLTFSKERPPQGILCPFYS